MTYVRRWEFKRGPWHYPSNRTRFGKHRQGLGKGFEWWWFDYRCHRSRSGPRKRNRRG